GLETATDVFYAGADVYAMTSREDPFPSVILEAMDAGLPVVGFEGAGGFCDLVLEASGVLVPAFDAKAFGAALSDFLMDEGRRRAAGEVGRRLIASRYSFDEYARDLLSFAGLSKRVSVIVPNYNYARYIEARLASVASQTIQPYELIVLDDASTDDSVARIRRFLADTSIPSYLVVNEENSGSVFRQWQRGVEMARGDYVWIAEADDLADPEFLETLLPSFERPDVVMSYCQSRQMDGDGNILCEHYLDYVADVDAERWTRPYVADGREEIARALFLKNTIPNVSGVIFRREPLLATLAAHAEEILSFRNAGDWVTYLRLLENGAVAFSPRSLNSHRRHQSSVTVGNFNVGQLQEIVRVQRETIRRYELGQDAIARADRYSQDLYERFGLKSGRYPYFEALIGHGEIWALDQCSLEDVAWKSPIRRNN
ncbi:MAG: glycosyltransferase, partial [Pseudorhodoplanes sp.]|nr:glycosyltransferase [Pseudorhodoplanes sp.]